MIVSCGSCQSKFRIDPAKVPASGTRLRCPKCKGVITVGPATPPAAPASAAPARAPAPAAAPAPGQAASPPPGAGQPPTQAPAAPLVVVAHGNAAFCETVASFLARNHFGCETATDGEAALALVAARRPAALLVDVALPGVVGYKVCEQIKADPALQATRVVLIGAIYDRSRYRRPPASLYGSDAYIEKHEIPEKLVPLLRSLLAGETAAPEAGSAAARPAAKPDAPVPGAAAAKSAPAREPAAAPPRPPAGPEAGGSPGSEQARRLARIIVSDIVLYNPDVVKRGIAEGNLPDLLKDEL
ncbi:MAG TPA: zinc-ribbon domain-containing protein, partial [Thermodesulfobacteriota bacterium]